MKSFFQSSLSVAFSSSQSSHANHIGCIPIPTTATTTATATSTSTTTYHYYCNNLSSCSFRTRRKISSIVCSQNSENASVYTDLSTALARPELNYTDGDSIAWKDMVVDGGMGRTTTTATAAPTPLKDSFEHIGIGKFLQGKTYLITGATGFLAKVFIEKMLRTVPDVRKIFLLIKAKDKDAAMDRLRSEIIDSGVFECLEQMHGKSYRAFMLSKLVPVVGNVCESNLGMDAESASEIAKDVDVIVNSAANTTFDERYDIALNTNTKGPSRLLSFAKKCDKLSLFLHVSTAYVNGERQGVILEKPFCMGESIARERVMSESPPKKSLPAALDIDAEIKVASDLLMESFHENAATQKMKELGLERARIHGWQNTYVFTKAMGEMIINSTRGDIPVVIIRPSIIGSACREPFPGWIQGNRMVDPIILSYAKGQLPGFLGDPKTVMDMIPVDMVVNASMAAMAKHGNAGRQPGLTVYHVASSVVNPLVFDDLINFSRDYFTTSPFMDSKGKRISISGMKYFGSIDDFASYIWNETVGQSGLMDAAAMSDQKLLRRLQMKCKKKVDYVIHLAKIYEPYMFYGGWFDNGNTQKLLEGMSGEEKSNFGFDVGSIDWKDYISNVHNPGLRRHVLKGRVISG